MGRFGVQWQYLSSIRCMHRTDSRWLSSTFTSCTATALPCNSSAIVVREVESNQGERERESGASDCD